MERPFFALMFYGVGEYFDIDAKLIKMVDMNLIKSKNRASLLYYNETIITI